MVVEAGRVGTLLVLSGFLRLNEHFDVALLIADHFWRPIFLVLHQSASSWCRCRIGQLRLKLASFELLRGQLGVIGA